jgi:hypothetical protein
MLLIRVAAFAAILAAAGVIGSTGARSAAADYRFEDVGKPQPSTGGKSVVSVRLVHVPDNKPVPGAIIIQTKADMGPDGMADMTAPVQAVSGAVAGKEPGIYRFEVQPGMAGKWMLTLAAKVQGESQTVRGSVVVELAK